MTPTEKLDHNRRFLFAKSKCDPDRDWRDNEGWRHHLMKRMKIDPRHFHGLLYAKDVEAKWEQYKRLRKTWWHWKQHTAVIKGNRTKARMKREAAKKEGRRLPTKLKERKRPGRPSKTRWVIEVIE